MVAKRALAAAKKLTTQAAATAVRAVTKAPVAARGVAPTKKAAPPAKKAAPPAKKAAPPAKKTAPAAKKAAPVAKKTAPAKKAAPVAKKTAPAAKKAAPVAKKAAPAPPAKKAAPPAKKAAASARVTLLVRQDETPWTKAELAALRAEVTSDVAHLRAELEQAEHELVDLMRDSGDGAGDDQADAGAKTYEREQEISLANNARDMLQQNLHALDRMDDGTYGICESCGNPIGKLRLQAAPRATLCMPCKKKEERR